MKPAALVIFLLLAGCVTNSGGTTSVPDSVEVLQPICTFLCFARNDGDPAGVVSVPGPVGQ